MCGYVGWLEPTRALDEAVLPPRPDALQRVKCWTWESNYSVSLNPDTFDANYYRAVIAKR